MLRRFHSILFLLVFMESICARAGDFFSFKESYFLLSSHQFSGERLLGFTNASSGYGGTLGKNIWAKSRFTLFAEAGGYFIQGQETFQDGSQQKLLDHNGIVSGLKLGGRLRVLGSDKGSQLYIGALGVGEFIYIKLPVDMTYLALNQTDNAFMTGYQLELGLRLKSSKLTYIFSGRMGSVQGDIFNKPTYTSQGTSFYLGIQF